MLKWIILDFFVFILILINILVEEGSSLIFLCRVYGSDKLVIIWLIDDGSGIVVVIVMGIEVLVDFSGDLKYIKVIFKNRGLYICKVCNIVGCRIVKVFLDVLCKLFIYLFIDLVKVW